VNTVERWSVELSIGEDDSDTRAEALLIVKEGERLSGHGTARRNPADPNVTEIGEQIAVARALSDLAHKLLNTAAAGIESATHERAHLHL